VDKLAAFSNSLPTPNKRLVDAINYLSTNSSNVVSVQTGDLIEGVTPVDTAYSLPCLGGVYSISDYPKLGSLLGDLYGGNGVTTFGVPDSPLKFDSSMPISIVDTYSIIISPNSLRPPATINSNETLSVYRGLAPEGYQRDVIVDLITGERIDVDPSRYTFLRSSSGVYIDRPNMDLFYGIKSYSNNVGLAFWMVDPRSPNLIDRIVDLPTINYNFKTVTAMYHDPEGLGFYVLLSGDTSGSGINERVLLFIDYATTTTTEIRKDTGRIDESYETFGTLVPYNDLLYFARDYLDAAGATFRYDTYNIKTGELIQLNSVKTSGNHAGAAICRQVIIDPRVNRMYIEAYYGTAVARLHAYDLTTKEFIEEVQNVPPYQNANGRTHYTVAPKSVGLYCVASQINNQPSTITLYNKPTIPKSFLSIKI
jgi:hypothetical protein